MATKPITRPRVFAVQLDRASMSLNFNNAQTGAFGFRARMAELPDVSMTEAAIYGVRQLCADASAGETGWDAKLGAARAQWDALVAGTYRNGERAAGKRLVMESVYVAGRGLGILFPSETDDATARKRWADLTEYNRLRFAARPDVVDAIAWAAGSDADTDDVFA